MKRILSVGDLSTTDSVDFDRADGGPFTQVKTRSKKTRKVANADRSNKATTGSELEPDSHSVCTSAADGQSSMLGQLQKSVSELSSVVQAQKLVIDRLSAQLNFLLSYLDISNIQIASNLSTNIVPSDIPGNPSIAIAQSAPSDADSAGTSSVKDNALAPTYASIAGANQAGNMSHMNNNNNFREVVATVVYANQRDKDRRAKSVIVNGLMPINGISDSNNFHQLCISEFSINPQIVSIRRLGKSSVGRVKPLLVILSSKDVADDIKHAKLLRRSTVSTVRDNVFINRNLTKIEAQLAYNERCQRRQRLQQRQRQQP